MPLHAIFKLLTDPYFIEEIDPTLGLPAPDEVWELPTFDEM